MKTPNKSQRCWQRPVKVFVLPLLTGTTPASLLPASVQLLLRTLKSSPNEDAPPLLARHGSGCDSWARKQRILTCAWSPLSTDGEDDVTGKIITSGIPCRQLKGHLQRADNYLCFESTFTAFDSYNGTSVFWVHCYFRVLDPVCLHESGTGWTRWWAPTNESVSLFLICCPCVVFFAETCVPSCYRCALVYLKSIHTASKCTKSPHERDPSF